MTVVASNGVSLPSVVERTIFEYADDLMVQVATSCGRSGQCHECVVEVKRGFDKLTPRTRTEQFLRDPYRLACQAAIADVDGVLEFTPLRREPRILGPNPDRERAVDIEPMVTTDGSSVFYDASTRLGRFRGAILGLAVDLGTTTVVAELVDLVTGDTLAVSSVENPQRFGGSDVMHRISYDALPNATGELQNAVLAAVNQEIRVMTRRIGRRPPDIFEVVVAGNATMRDLFFGLDVQSIGQKPYKSTTEHAFLAGDRPTTALLADAADLGLRVNSQAKVYGLPLVASHVGGDTAACIEAVGLLADGDETVMLIDMGTNTEVVLRHAGRMYAASCPAGPAFEGGLVGYGMAAYDGAIESMTLGEDATATAYSTIGGAPALGICGSGLIDLLAELRRLDLMTEKGVFTDDRRRSHVIIVPDRGISFSKEDASNLAQAKAANFCGQVIVLRTAGIGPTEVDRVLLAGAFANHVDVANAVRIGLLAPVPEERVVKVGNAAIDGARAMLLWKRKRALLQKAVTDITHVELETTPDFFEVFVEGSQLKPMPEDLDGLALANAVASAGG